MKKRIIVALLALVICIPIIVYGKIPFYIGASLIGLLGFMELLNLRCKKKSMPYIIKIFSVISFILLMTSNWNLFGSLYMFDYEIITAIVFLLIVPIVFFNKSKKYDIDDALFLLGGVAFLGISFNQLVNIRVGNLNTLLFLLLITIVTDTFGLFTGLLIGKNKLSPTVSPKKTWEGFVGGLLFGSFVSTCFYMAAFDYTGSILKLVLVTASLSVVGQVGDLVFSAIKRSYGVKDFGNLMPEHGGILDRLDSLIFVVLAFSYVVRFL